MSPASKKPAMLVYHHFPNAKGTMRRDEESGALIAEGAVVVGDVRLARDVNVWFGCVLRGDDEPITVGEATNLQDGTIVHVDFGVPTMIGRRVTIGHRALIHGAIIAREMQIPCVNGIARAVDLLPDGEIVTVDGHLGIVTIGPPEFDLELR